MNRIDDIRANFSDAEWVSDLRPSVIADARYLLSLLDKRTAALEAAGELADAVAECSSVGCRGCACLDYAKIATVCREALREDGE